MLSWFRNRRRRRLLSTPPPKEWTGYLRSNFKQWAWFSEDEQRTLLDIARILIAEKYWEGCAGLELTEEMQVVIAAQAAVLLLGMEHDYYHHVKTILVYPSGYYVPSGSSRFATGIIPENPSGMLGQAHYRGPVILSWRHAQRGGANPGDGRNLVLHEFAHQLDMMDGLIDGTPPIQGREQFDEWVRVMTREYNNLQQGGANGQQSILRNYAATNPAEFFAVATEVFFEQPLRLRGHHPDLYRVLMDYYKQDTAKREESGRAIEVTW